MPIIDESSQPAATHAINKEMTSLNTASEHTVSLEEDEKMFGDDHSQLTDEFMSSSHKTNDAHDDTFCSSGQSDVRSVRATRVNFAPMASYYRTISRDQYTEDEIEQTFWTPKQWNVLNKGHLKTVLRLKAGIEEKRSAPYRGLEKCTPEGYQHALKARNAYVNTVLDEMERQRKESENELLDWKKIAGLTKAITKQSAQEAIKVALYDFGEAREAYLAIEARKELVQPQQQQQPKSRSVSNTFSGYLRNFRSGLPHLAGRRASKKVSEPSRLESIFQTAERLDQR